MIGVEPREVPISPRCLDVEDRDMTNESPTSPLPDDSEHDPDNEERVAETDDPTTDRVDELSEQIAAEPFADGSPDHTDADLHDQGRPPPPPPPPPPPSAPGGPPYQPPVRRLVRDPYTRLGGVASGISHYTGLDTSIIRILFIVTTLTGGFGLLVYLLAWLVIPRADYWPPATAPVSYRNMSGRDLGIGLALVGLLIAVGFGASGATGGILVPLVLVAGGVWLLAQPPSTPIPATADGGSAAPFVAGHSPIGAPVPPPKRRPGRWLIALAAVGALLALLMIPVLIVLGLAFGSLGDTTRFTPTTVEEIPTFFSDDVDRLEIDLSQLDADDFASETMPVEISADIDLGSILVIVPDDISVSVDSNVDLGSISVFGKSVDGIDNTYSSGGPGSGATAVDLDLRLEIDVGEITVERP
jgi:phage shock protein PspC (stress-responsive transcriptional regulator)